jgi:hypothetical protein
MPLALRGLLAPAAALGAAALLAAPAFAEHASRHFEFQGKPSLTIAVDDANVHVRPGPPGRIDVELETRGWRIGNGGLRIVAEQDGNEIHYEVRQPHGFFIFSFNVGRHVDLDVHVPPELDLEVTTGDGSVAVGDLSGEIHLHTGDGNVDGQHLRGDLVIESGDGRVVVEGCDGGLRARSGDGRVRVEGRFDRLDVGTSDGSVEVEALPRSTVADEWRVTTGDGPVVVRLPRDLHADLDLHTGDGAISTDLALEVSGTVSGRTLRGWLNGGGERIVLRTGDGSIRVEGS